MNNTKTIFKSLLIMIVAISLFTVSCSKDEGGTKTPTNPAPKDSATLLTEMLKRLGQLKGTEQADKDTVMVDLSKINPQNGNAAISGANQNYNKVKTALANVLKTETFQNEQIGLNAAPTINVKPSGSEALSVVLTFKANTGYTFDDSITGKGKTTYTYNESDKTATLTLKITPAKNWE